jgi:hypothetical protein
VIGDRNLYRGDRSGYRISFVDNFRSSSVICDRAAFIAFCIPCLTSRLIFSAQNTGVHILTMLLHFSYSVFFHLVLIVYGTEVLLFGMYYEYEIQ